MYLHAHTHTHTHTHARTHARTHTPPPHTHTHRYMHTYIYIYTHIYPHIYIYILCGKSEDYTRVYECTCVCVYKHTHTNTRAQAHTHTHTHTHTHVHSYMIFTLSRHPRSSMIFGTNALITKPAVSLAPMIAVAFLSRFGYQDAEHRNKTTFTPDHDLADAMFYLAAITPIVVGIVQLFVWGKYNIRDSHITIEKYVDGCDT